MRSLSVLRLSYELREQYFAENVGAVAFSRTGDLAIGEFADAVVLKAFGEVPSDLSAL